MTLVTGLTAAGFQARLDDLEAAITALIDAQHTYDTTHYAPIAEPVAVAATTARQNAITQEVTDRNAAIQSETDWRTFWCNAVKPKSYLAARRSTSFSLTATSWANLDTGMDLVVPAAAGDLIECSVSGTWGVEANQGMLDVVSIVSGNPVNSWATNGAPVPPATTQGVQAWRGDSGVVAAANGVISRRVVAGDISGGNVTLRLRCVMSYATPAKTLYATSQLPFIWQAINYEAG